MLGGFISSNQDGIIRSFYAPGMSSTAGQPDDCTLEPGINTVTSALLLGQYDGAKFSAGLKDVMDNIVPATSAGYYLMPTDLHMHLWRARFFEKNGNDLTIAEWMAEILAGDPTKTGVF